MNICIYFLLKTRKFQRIITECWTNRHSEFSFIFPALLEVCGYFFLVDKSSTVRCFFFFKSIHLEQLVCWFLSSPFLERVSGIPKMWSLIWMDTFHLFTIVSILELFALSLLFFHWLFFGYFYYYCYCFSFGKCGLPFECILFKFMNKWQNKITRVSG